MPLLRDFTELFPHPVCFQALPTQLRLSGSLPPAPPTSHLPFSPLPTPTLEKAAAILHSVTHETSRCCGDNGLLASLPLPAASQKLGAASKELFWPRHHQPKHKHFLWLLGRRQLFPFSKCLLPAQCCLLEANVWLRRQCQAKYFLCIKIPLIF